VAHTVDLANSIGSVEVHILRLHFSPDRGYCGPSCQSWSVCGGALVGVWSVRDFCFGKPVAIGITNGDCVGLFAECVGLSPTKRMGVCAVSTCAGAFEKVPCTFVEYTSDMIYPMQQNSAG
jgi:hypothetical protein